MEYKTPINESKLLGKMATKLDDTTNKQNRDGFCMKDSKVVLCKLRENKNTLLRKWKLNISIGLATCYGPCGDYECENSKTEFCGDMTTEGTIWSKRTIKNKKFINTIMKKSQKENCKNLMYWLENDSEYNDLTQMTFCQLILSLEHAPIWNVEMVYGPTQFTKKEIQDMVVGLFEHYFRAGDMNFEILETNWTSLKIDNMREEINKFNQMIAKQNADQVKIYNREKNSLR